MVQICPATRQTNVLPGKYFDPFVGAVIFANSITIGIEAETSLQAELVWKDGQLYARC